MHKQRIRGGNENMSHFVSATGSTKLINQFEVVRPAAETIILSQQQ